MVSLVRRQAVEPAICRLRLASRTQANTLFYKTAFWAHPLMHAEPHVLIETGLTTIASFECPLTS